MIKFSNILAEIGVNKPSQTWNLDKPGVKFERIQEGDILEFSLYDTNPPQKVKQIVHNKGLTMIGARDLPKKDLPQNQGGWDWWTKTSLENYWEKNK